MILATLLLAAPVAIVAQETTYPELSAARAALDLCLAFVAGANAEASRDDSRAAAGRAEKAFRAAIAARPQDPKAHAGLGEALSRCGIPHASMTSIMGVVEASSAALQKALELEPSHWEARFILAMNSYNMPAFLNRTGAAIRELEILRQTAAYRPRQPIRPQRNHHRRRRGCPNHSAEMRGVSAQQTWG
jgi:hypothetical protein